MRQWDTGCRGAAPPPAPCSPVDTSAGGSLAQRPPDQAGDRVLPAHSSSSVSWSGAPLQPPAPPLVGSATAPAPGTHTPSPSPLFSCTSCQQAQSPMVRLSLVSSQQGEGAGDRHICTSFQDAQQDFQLTKTSSSTAPGAHGGLGWAQFLARGPMPVGSWGVPQLCPRHAPEQTEAHCAVGQMRKARPPEGWTPG